MGTALSQQRTTRAFGEVTRGRAVYVRADASGIEIERRPAASGVRSVDTFVSTGSRQESALGAALAIGRAVRSVVQGSCSGWGLRVQPRRA